MSAHDDVIKWKHIPRYWPFVREIHRSPVNSPHKGQWRGALMFSLIWVWTNDWVNNRDAGDLRCHRVHYDVSLLCDALDPKVASVTAGMILTNILSAASEELTTYIPELIRDGNSRIFYVLPEWSQFSIPQGAIDYKCYIRARYTQIAVLRKFVVDLWILQV